MNLDFRLFVDTRVQSVKSLDVINFQYPNPFSSPFFLSPFTPLIKQTLFPDFITIPAPFSTKFNFHAFFVNVSRCINN